MPIYGTHIEGTAVYGHKNEFSRKNEILLREQHDALEDPSEVHGTVDDKCFELIREKGELIIDKLQIAYFHQECKTSANGGDLSEILLTFLNPSP